jgi:ribosome-binding factor A
MRHSKRSVSAGPSQRQLRVSELIRQLVSGIFLRRELRDPLINKSLVTITEVRIGGDLHTAVIYITCPTSSDVPALLKALQEATREIRSLIAPHIHLKFLPNLQFRYDDTFESAQYIDALITRYCHPAPVSDE